MKKIIYITILVLFCLSCEEAFLDPTQDNTLQESSVWADPEYAQGVLVGVYRTLPLSPNWEVEGCSDDAIVSRPASYAIKISSGGWSANYYPFAKWGSAYEQIALVNLFLENGLNIEYSKSDKDKDRETRKRLKGEAFFLRAYFEWQLLQYHGGKGSDGVMYGFPIITEPLDAATSDLNLKRNTFEECVQQIFNDCDTAIALLPADYEGADPFLGERHYGRGSGNAAKALKSRVATLAASPAFTDGNDNTSIQQKWERAARLSYECISALNPLDSTGVMYYFPQGEPIEYGPDEIIMRAPRQNAGWFEELVYPPSIGGQNGYLHPTQNLVDAFPMENGYPITDFSNSGYNLGEPYSNRDPRFYKYILFNGAEIQETKIITAKGGFDTQIKTATRTSYYLRKLINEEVVVTPNSVTSKIHLIPLFRQTEIYLNFAEASNEAWGPQVNQLGLSSYDAIKMIRDRAGITSDEYLNNMASDVDNFRELIHTERRIELCFEGFRFWDVRRWLEPINVMTYGMEIEYSEEHEIGIYTVKEVEQKLFSDYMYYGPIPFSEMQKVSNMVQNQGW